MKGGSAYKMQIRLVVSYADSLNRPIDIVGAHE